MIDDVGLASAARWFVEGMGQRSGMQVTLDAPRHLERLPAEIELMLFRVLQEGLTNVHRHSGASVAQVADPQGNWADDVGSERQRLRHETGYPQPL